MSIEQNQEGDEIKDIIYSRLPKGSADAFYELISDARKAKKGCCLLAPLKFVRLLGQVKHTAKAMIEGYNREGDQGTDQFTK